MAIQQLGEGIYDIFVRYPTYDEVIHKLIVSSHDPIRYSTMALAINTIRKQQISGNLAEVGVWRGDTSRIIHLCAPEKTLYLFDTFEGYPPEDLDHEDGRFKDTSIEIVRQTIGDLTNVVIKKGYFPETARGLEDEVFALVMLDLDLYKPMRAAIEFFYSRMSPGGYIFVHDYNHHPSGPAVIRAINDFMDDKPEKLIEIPDVWGTIVIRKM
jgi:O-methyltransferase